MSNAGAQNIKTNNLHNTSKGILKELKKVRARYRTIYSALNSNNIYYMSWIDCRSLPPRRSLASKWSQQPKLDHYRALHLVSNCIAQAILSSIFVGNFWIWRRSWKTQNQRTRGWGGGGGVRLWYFENKQWFRKEGRCKTMMVGRGVRSRREEITWTRRNMFFCFSKNGANKPMTFREMG